MVTGDGCEKFMEMVASLYKPNSCWKRSVIVPVRRKECMINDRCFAETHQHLWVQISSRNIWFMHQRRRHEEKAQFSAVCLAVLFKTDRRTEKNSTNLFVMDQVFIKAFNYKQSPSTSVNKTSPCVPCVWSLNTESKEFRKDWHSVHNRKDIDLSARLKDISPNSWRVCSWVCLQNKWCLLGRKACEKKETHTVGTKPSELFWDKGRGGNSNFNRGTRSADFRTCATKTWWFEVCQTVHCRSEKWGRWIEALKWHFHAASQE